MLQGQRASPKGGPRWWSGETLRTREELQSFSDHFRSWRSPGHHIFQPSLIQGDFECVPRPTPSQNARPFFGMEFLGVQSVSHPSSVKDGPVWPVNLSLGVHSLSQAGPGSHTWQGRCGPGRCKGRHTPQGDGEIPPTPLGCSVGRETDPRAPRERGDPNGGSGGVEAHRSSGEGQTPGHSKPEDPKEAPRVLSVWREGVVARPHTPGEESGANGKAPEVRRAGRRELNPALRIGKGVLSQLS
jgi:hypothetical protein